MKLLSIAPTATTPSVTLNPETGQLMISGRSLPEDAGEFYYPVLQWLQAYRAQPQQATDLNLRFEYLNTTSVKVMQEIFTSLKGLPALKITWTCDEEDEDLYDVGTDLMELSGLEFQFSRT